MSTPEFSTAPTPIPSENIHPDPHEVSATMRLFNQNLRAPFEEPNVVDNGNMVMGSDGAPTFFGGDEPAFSGATTANAVGLVAFGSMLKDTQPLEPQSVAVFDQYCATWDSDERLAIEFFNLLQVKDLLTRIVKPAKWVVSEDLKKNCTLYARTFLFSPLLRAYKSSSAPRQVLSAMRELGVNDLPAEKSPLAVQDVLTAIGDQLTHARHDLKKRIAESLEKDSPTRNIADLCKAIASMAGFQASAQMYLRVAWLRAIYVTSYMSPESPPKPDTSNFYDIVDRTLKEWLAKATSDAELHQVFMNVYIDDKKVYGDPIKSVHNTSTYVQSESWVLTMDKHAGDDQVAAAAGTKRRRAK